MLGDTGANVTLLRTYLANYIKKKIINPASTPSKRVAGDRENIYRKLGGIIKFGSRVFELKIYF